MIDSIIFICLLFEELIIIPVLSNSDNKEKSNCSRGSKSSLIAYRFRNKLQFNYHGFGKRTLSRKLPLNYQINSSHKYHVFHCHYGSAQFMYPSLQQQEIHNVTYSDNWFSPCFYTRKIVAAEAIRKIMKQVSQVNSKFLNNKPPFLVWPYFKWKSKFWL